MLSNDLQASLERAMNTQELDLQTIPEPLPDMRNQANESYFDAQENFQSVLRQIQSLAHTACDTDMEFDLLRRLNRQLDNSDIATRVETHDM